MVLTPIIPARPNVGMLSIPRALWVSIPGQGENRINTAHFFAEASEPGSGPRAAMDVVRTNFGVDVDYFVRLRVEGLLTTIAQPIKWPRLVVAVPVLLGSIDTDVPVWLWPRLGLAFLRAGPGGIDGRGITRAMAHGFTTTGGAQVP